MKHKPEALVIGAGPAGSYAALNLAKLGVPTTVFEEHPEIGVPSHCAGHLSIRSLGKMGLYPLPYHIVENEFSKANFYSPTGFRFSVHLKQPVTCTVNRTLFDKFLAEKAEAAGARFLLNTRVKSLILDEGFVRGVRIKEDEETREIFSKTVVDAEGISSRVLRETSLSTLKTSSVVYGVEADAENVRNVEHDAVEVFLGKAYASGFYGWLIPRRDGTAKVGLATTGNPKESFQKLKDKHPVASEQLSTAKITNLSFHPISLGGPISQTYTNGFLAVGDAASQVKPTTGGGVVFGMTCAKIAAEIVYNAIQKNDLSENFLRLYQKRCEEIWSFDVKVMLRIRKTLNTISDKKIEKAMRFCSRIGLDKTLGNIEEIDFQGQTFLKVLKKPAIVAVFAYFVLLYLSANP